MGDQDDMGAGLAGRPGDESMPGDARRGGQAGGGLVAGPDQPAPVGADGAGGGLRLGRPVGAVGVEAMVDRERQKAAAVRAGPVGGEMQQGDGISAPGKGDGEGAVAVGAQAGGQAAFSLRAPVRIGAAQPGLRAGGRVAAGARAGVQAKRVPSSMARVRWGAVAVAA